LRRYIPIFSQSASGIKDISLVGNIIKMQYANGKTKDLDISSLVGAGIHHITYSNSGSDMVIYFTKTVPNYGGYGGSANGVRLTISSLGAFYKIH